jgi:GGDEF domain-containing protein
LFLLLVPDSGKFFFAAVPALFQALTRLDFSTLSQLTIPHFNLMTIFRKQPGKFMRCAPGHGMRVLATLLLTVLLGLFGSVSRAQAVVVLSPQTPFINLQAKGLAWVDTEAQASITQVVRAKNQQLMQAVQANTIYNLGAQAALWQHYRLQRSKDAATDWVLEFPFPGLDKVSVFQRAADGSWSERTAGDSVEVASWPTPGRYAQFHLLLTDEQVQDIYVRVQHASQVNIPVNVVAGKVQSDRLQMDYLLIGAILGTMLLLALAGAAEGWIHRDTAYGWYSFYALIMALIVASTSGLGGHLLWSTSANWNNSATGVLSLMGGSVALLVARTLCAIAGRHLKLDRAVYWVGIAGPVLASVFMLLERRWGVWLVVAYLLVVALLGMATAIVTRQRQDRVGTWVLAGATPLVLATVLTVARTVGWIPSSWVTEYTLMLSFAIVVPMLLVALNIRTSDRHSIEAREQAMTSRDALTGLLAPHLFQDRLQQVLSRAKRDKEVAAVVYVELVNYHYIKRTFGTAAAEQSLLRCVIKLRRNLSDVDTVGRVDEACFGLIMEGVASRKPVTDMATQLIASGLMPLKGLKPALVLEFHVAAALLNGKKLVDEADLSPSLFELLASMAERTRRPIRFLETARTMPVPLQAEAARSTVRKPAAA